MPRCRKCKKDWPAATTICPDDGYSFTVEVDATMHPALMAAAAALPVRKPAIAGATLGGAPIKRPSPAAAPPPRAAPVRAMAMAMAADASGDVGEYEPTAMLSGDAAAAVVAHEPEPKPEPEPEHSSADVPTGTVVGEYRIEKKIGEGGMGAVYSAVHPMIGKKAAIKVISSALGTDASAVQRFVDEARAVNQIGHPNIVDVFAFGALPDGRNYFVMEHLQGESLGDRIASATMSLGEAMEILDQVADALEAAHEKQIVHRDLKPDNVYLAAVRGGRTMVKLLDFGIAKLSVAEGGIAKTRTGMMMGTPGYISPEQARGRNVDHRTDIYALGCMMFEIVCGRLPFIADNAMDIVLMHMTATPQRPSELWPEIPPPLEQLIIAMLDKNPDNRPTLAQIRGTFSELVTSGLVTIDNKRGSAFRSGLGATPTGTPIPRLGAGTSTVPLGTSPGTLSGSGAVALGTTPPQLGQFGTVSGDTIPPAPKRRPMGLIIGALAGVVLLGVVGVVMATRGDTAAPVVQPKAPEPPPIAAITPPEPPKPVETPKTVPADALVEPPKVTGGVVSLKLFEKSKVVLDGKEVAATASGAEIKITDDGPHKIIVTAPGKLPWEKSFEVTAGAALAFEAKLERLKRVPPVVGTGSAKQPPVVPPTVKKPDEGTCDPFAPGSKC